MDPGPIILALVLGALAVAATAVAVSRSRQIAALRVALRSEPGDDLERVARDAVAARDAATQEAHARRDDLERLLEIVAVGVVRLDEGRVIRTANRAAHVLLGRRAGSLVGLTPMEAFADHRIEELWERAEAAPSASGELEPRGGGASTLAVRIRRADHASWIVFEDVSELRRLQRIRAEFIDNLSHELRTPLTTIRLLTETLGRDLERATVSDRIRDRVAKIDVESGHLVQMVTELLDLSRIESGGPPLFLADVDLRRVVSGTLDRLRLFAERQGVELRADVPADLPLVRGDTERLGQLLLNLLHNAVKFSDPGHPVVVRARAEPSEVVVSVIDSGPGIPRADLERVFERFYKVDKARTRVGGGTGLGLSIARHIAESHGGRLSVASEEGSGATFSLSLPR